MIAFIRYVVESGVDVSATSVPADAGSIIVFPDELVMVFVLNLGADEKVLTPAIVSFPVVLTQLAISSAVASVVVLLDVRLLVSGMSIVSVKDPS